MWQLAERMDCSLPMIFISGMEEIQQLPKKKIDKGDLGTVYYTKASWVRRRGIRDGDVSPIVKCRAVVRSLILEPIC